MFEHSTKQVDEYMQKLFTPEQKQKFRELDISQMGRAKGPINPDMLEALGLSEEQREKMKKIQKDLAPQYEQYLDKAADWQVRLSNRIDDVVEPLTHISGSSQEEMNERMQKYFKEYSKHRQIIKDEPEFKDAIQKSDELQTAYFTALKFQMYDVLTDEQMNRLSELINNPPDYVKLAMGSDSQTSSEPPSFLNSWKPGDPIPEEYKKHRENRRRFPQKK